MRHPLAWILFLVVLLLAAAQAEAARFRRGDSNGTGDVDLTDAVNTLNVLFSGTPPLNCEDAMDANDDKYIDLTDAVHTLTFLFSGGDPIPEPYPDCGEDETPDDHGCVEYPECPQIDCYDEEDLDATIAQEVVNMYCIPAGMTEVDVSETMHVSVCPAAGASPCGTEAQPGCPVFFTTVEGTLDKANWEVLIHLEGNVEDLPIVVTDTVFQTETTCLNDITFSGDAVLPVVVTENQDGTATVTDLDVPIVENAEVNLTSEGGLLCKFLENQKDAFLEQLLQQLQDSAAGFAEDLRPEVVGKVICP